ncbi:ABC transporter ATP-binding protein [Streptomyces sp. NPDC001340]
MHDVLAQASGLSTTFGKKRVLEDVSLQLRSGKITGFVGANGAGKTTTLRCMLGLLPSAGETSFLGRPLTRWNAPARVVGAVFGGVAGHPKHRLITHLRMVAAGCGLPDRRADEVLDAVGLSTGARVRLKELSLGMAQRAGIAQALIASPRVLLLDEPANGLDPHAMRWLRDLLRQLADEGLAVLVSSHLLSEMEQVADRVAVLSKGRIVADAEMADLLAYAEKQAVVTVETPDLDRFASAIVREGVTVDRRGDHWAQIKGLSRHQVGELAAEHRITLYTISENRPSLEDFYLTIAEEEFAVR